MRGYYTLFCVMVLCMSHKVLGQNMQGEILDYASKQTLADVNVTNIHTGEVMLSDEKGRFAVTVVSGQLVEFRREGYKVLRVRVPQGKLPSFFRVIMQEEGTNVIDYVNGRGAAPDYKTDSIRYRKIYGSTLDVPKLEGLDAIRHPFSAMSKKNRQIWAFQEEYEMYQQQKYIDYTFNEKLITYVTNLKGDSLYQYMQMFRPTYQQLRSMNEYTYLNYIKQTVEAYRRRGIRARQPYIKGSN